MSYNTKCYREQGGDRWVIADGGEIKVESGGKINLESGSSLQQDNKVASVAYTIGTEAANVINVGLQLNDAEGNAIAAIAALNFYLSSDAAGKDIESSGPDSIAIGTDGSLYMSGGDSLIAGLMVSEADGDIDLDLTHAGADTFYFCTILPDGSVAVSSAITFDATT